MIQTCCNNNNNNKLWRARRNACSLSRWSFSFRLVDNVKMQKGLHELWPSKNIDYSMHSMNGKNWFFSQNIFMDFVQLLQRTTITSLTTIQQFVFWVYNRVFRGVEIKFVKTVQI
jgi:hypothetical protein